MQAGTFPMCAEPLQAPTEPLRSSYRHMRPLYRMQPWVLNTFGTRRSEVEEILGVFWMPATLFATVELGAFLGVRKSFFVAITGDAFENGHLYGQVVEIHVWASAAMWALAANQILGERFRKSPMLSWVHRRSGQAMLGLFYSVVLPTSLYLSFKQRIDFLAPAVAAVLLDTATCTSYFLLRGWCVARRRRNSDSLALHGRLMQCGVLMSMSILPQRLLQLYLTCSQRFNHQANYTASILLTSVLFVYFEHFLDGPRGGVWLSCIGPDNQEEAYGSARASWLERMAWRSRWAIYAITYFCVRRWYVDAAPHGLVHHTTEKSVAHSR